MFKEKFVLPLQKFVKYSFILKNKYAGTDVVHGYYYGVDSVEKVDYYAVRRINGYMVYINIESVAYIVDWIDRGQHVREGDED